MTLNDLHWETKRWESRKKIMSMKKFFIQHNYWTQNVATSAVVLSIFTKHLGCLEKKTDWLKCGATLLNINNACVLCYIFPLIGIKCSHSKQTLLIEHQKPIHKFQKMHRVQNILIFFLSFFSFFFLVCLEGEPQKYNHHIPK